MRILFLLLVSIYLLNAKELQKVSIQLQWLDQFQFAGYYMAKEKGFYEEAGLDVDIKKYDYGIMPIDEVVQDRATFGIGRSSLLIDKANGKDITVLAAIFQTSPLVLLSMKNSGIEKIKDVLGRKIMATDDASTTASIHAMLKSYGIQENEIDFIPHSFDIEDLINKKTDLMASYISNEPYLLEKKALEYKVFDPKDYGFDFYSDILFTSHKVLLNKPKMVEKFRKASLKGWKYAFENIEQSVEIIYNKYNSQNKTKDMLMYEAQVLKQLAYYGDNKLGNISKEKMVRIVDIYRILGLLKKEVNLNDFLYKTTKKLTKAQKDYLKYKEDIKVCINPFLKPLEFIEDGKYKGMTADFLNEFSQMIGKKITLVPTSSWEESLSSVRQRKCDMLTSAIYTKQRTQYLDFTNTYISLPNIIATDFSAPYIYDLKLLKNKKLGVVKGYAYVENLKSKYPDKNFIDFDTLDDGLKALNKKEIYAFIDIAATLGEYIREKNYVNLKISGQMPEPVELKMATRNDEPILNEIIQYGFDNLSQELKNKIINKWQSIKLEEKKDYVFMWKVILFFLFLFMIFLFIFFKLKKSKELVEESLYNIEKILDTTIEGVCLVDENYKLMIINKSALDIFEYTKEEFLKLSLFDIVSSNSKNKVKEVLLKKDIRSYEINMLKKDGTEFPALVSGRDIIYKSKNARISTIIDLSSLKKAQDELKELNNELEKRVKIEVEKNIKKEKLLFQQSRQVQMGEMISMIAHQWRQPLSTISLSMIATKLKIDLNKFDLDSKEGIDSFIAYLKKQFDDVLDTVNNLSSIIDDFRVFYKPDDKAVELNINELINKSLNIMTISYEKDNIQFVKELDCDCKLLVYANELVQVFLNILKNSQDNFKYKKIQNRQVSIKTFCGVDTLNIEIEDNGGGIDDEVLPKIFDPYFSTKDEKNGTGLGLYMSKTIIEEHHKGKLYAKNTQNGVKFVIELKR